MKIKFLDSLGINKVNKKIGGLFLVFGAGLLLFLVYNAGLFSSFSSPQKWRAVL